MMRILKNKNNKAENSARHIPRIAMYFFISIILIFLALAASACSADINDEEALQTSANISADQYEKAKEEYVDVKYKETPVNIADSCFEYLDTTGSEFINGAWYDENEKYMIIKLNDTYYHYCGLPSAVWQGFKKAEIFGEYYNKEIKEKYGCD